MFATAEVVSGVPAKAILIPSSAIQKIDGKPAAFVQQRDGSFAKKELQLGKEIGGKVKVKSGLTEGEKLVTEGTFILKSELLKETLAEE
jgi:cobalt-zinc-cadmium efflux system membrane fusion protein